MLNFSFGLSENDYSSLRVFQWLIPIAVIACLDCFAFVSFRLNWKRKIKVKKKRNNERRQKIKNKNKKKTRKKSNKDAAKFNDTSIFSVMQFCLTVWIVIDLFNLELTLKSHSIPTEIQLECRQICQVLTILVTDLMNLKLWFNLKFSMSCQPPPPAPPPLGHPTSRWIR